MSNRNRFEYYVVYVYTGAGEQFLLRGARIIGKIRFCQFSKNLLHKSWILGAPQAPAGPPPLCIQKEAMKHILPQKNQTNTFPNFS